MTRPTRENDPTDPISRSPVSWRSVTLGLGGAISICLLTAFNDYALNNTFLVGNSLPIGLVLLLFMTAVLINGPLSRMRSRHALSSGEMAIAFTMTLVACCVPSSGLMRYLPAALISPVWQGSSGGDFIGIFNTLDVPSWLFPAMSSPDRSTWPNDPVITGYFSRWRPGEMPPYAAWTVPILAWGVFVLALWGATLCMVAIVRRQWMDNERLAFPLAQIELALVEQPEPGRYFNSTLRQRSFWISFAIVFAIHSWNGLGAYFPGRFPEVPVAYDFTSLFTEPPLSFVSGSLKTATVYFTVVAVTYFLSTPVAFSLWFFFLLDSVVRMISGTLTGDPANPGQADQRFGGMVAFGLLVLWIGRAHWWLVIRQAFRGERTGEPRGRYLSYRFAFWGLLACATVMVAWLMAAGCGLLGAGVAVGLLLFFFLLIARIIAETGLVHGSLSISIQKPWHLLAWMGAIRPVSVESFYVSSIVQSTFYDFREPLSVYATHAVRVTDQTIYADRQLSHDTTHDRRLGRKIIGLMLLSLLVAYPASWAGMLWTEYRYAYTVDEKQEQVNNWGAVNSPRNSVASDNATYAQGVYVHSHNPPAHLGIGFGITSLLGWLRLQFAWWPLHPVGFLMIGTFPGNVLWLSIFVGWLSKSLVLRFGGASLYTAAKPFFIGLLVGEAVAAGFWLVINILLATTGHEFHAVRIMPW